jgi:phospholipid transport system transporter-binding protein
MLALPSVLTQTQATNCLKALLRGLKSVTDKAVVLDASALTQFDSAALAVLLEFRRETLALGKSFALQGMPPRLGNLATLYGIEDLLPAMSVVPIAG